MKSLSFASLLQIHPPMAMTVHPIVFGRGNYKKHGVKWTKWRSQFKFLTWRRLHSQSQNICKGIRTDVLKWSLISVAKFNSNALLSHNDAKLMHSLQMMSLHHFSDYELGMAVTNNGANTSCFIEFLRYFSLDKSVEATYATALSTGDLCRWRE